jgi:hypothetical protein
MDEVEHRRRRVRGVKGDASRSDADRPAPPVPSPADVAERVATDAAADGGSGGPMPVDASAVRGGAVTSETAAIDDESVLSGRAYATPAPSEPRPPAKAHDGSRTAGGRSHGVHGPHDGHGATSHDENERGLRGLVGGGSTQVSVAAAMRARDAARPTDADVADAEAHLTIVHRGWTPRDAV